MSLFLAPIVPIGRIFYALGLIGIGVQHFIFGDFIPVIVASWPAWIPGRPFWVYAVGTALIASGVAILANSKARPTAAILGAALLLLALFGHVPTHLTANPWHLFVWSNAFKALTLAGGAWVVAGSLPKLASLPQTLERLMPLGRYFLPVTVVVFGVEHFVYAAFVATLVPSWIPGHMFWTYFAGVALIASGIAVIVGIQARLASLLLGIMIFLWFVFLHIPRAIVDPRSGLGNEWTSVFEALAFSGIAFIMVVLPAPKRGPLSAG